MAAFVFGYPASVRVVIERTSLFTGELLGMNGFPPSPGFGRFGKVPETFGF
jgi:hypothetical protein